VSSFAACVAVQYGDVGEVPGENRTPLPSLRFRQQWPSLCIFIQALKEVVMAPHVKSSTGAATDTSWDQEDTYWRGNYQDRPYVGTNRNYDSWRPAYRYGWESANRYRGKNWSDVETDLRSGWDRYEHRGDARTTWEQGKAAVRDGWDRMMGRK
jgi:hypothetical protein